MGAPGLWKSKMAKGTHIRVGRAIREARERWGVTQAYLAKFVGCHPTAISTLETGKFGSLELLEAVTWALGLDLNRLHVERPQLPDSIHRMKKAEVRALQLVA